MKWVIDKDQLEEQAKINRKAVVILNIKKHILTKF
jgi:hypothetical protein